MAGPLAAPIIGAVGNLLGGLFGKKPKVISPADNLISQARGARLAGEEQGFNPLTLLGLSPQSQVYQPENYMGQAIANAGLMLAEGVAANGAEAQVTALERANQELNKKVQALTIRPKFGGIYSDNNAYTPTVREAVGAEGAYDPSSDDLVDQNDADSFGNKRIIGLPVGGVNLATYAGNADAETVETRYGDVASWAYGLGNIVADGWHNRGKAVDWAKGLPDNGDLVGRRKNTLSEMIDWKRKNAANNPDFINDFGTPMWVWPNGATKTSPPPLVIR